MVTTPGKPDEYPTVIGADASFNGELTFQGSVRIDGSFQGAIKTPGKVWISQSGKVKAEIAAGSVTVDGSVEGNITSEGRIDLNATCKLKGDVRAAKMQMAEGASWSGRCDVGPDAGKGRAAPSDAMRQITEAASGKK